MSTEVGINKEISLYRDMTHKVKLKKLYEKLKVTPNAAQAEMITDFDENFDKYYFFTVVMGRRSGKSYGTSLIATKELMVPYASVILVAPISRLTEIIWGEVKQRLIELGIKPTVLNNQERKLELENGSKLICGTANSPDSILGNRASLIIVDEAAIDASVESLLELQLLPTQSDFGVQENGMQYGRVLLISSPRGKNNYFYRQYLKGITGVKGYRSYQYPSSVNPLNTPQFLDNIKANTDPLVFAQEYMAQFLSITNANVLYSFDDTKNLFKFTKIQEFLKDSRVICGIDVGFRDNSAQVLVMKDRGNYYIFSGIRVNQSDTSTIIEAFKGQEVVFGVVPETRYVDRTAAMFSYDASSIYGYLTYPSASDVRLGFALLNQLFREEKLFIEESLIDLIQEIVSVEWADGKSNAIKRDSKGHSDLVMAMRYAIYSDFISNSSQEIVLLG